MCEESWLAAEGLQGCPGSSLYGDTAGTEGKEGGGEWRLCAREIREERPGTEQRADVSWGSTALASCLSMTQDFRASWLLRGRSRAARFIALLAPRVICVARVSCLHGGSASFVSSSLAPPPLCVQILLLQDVS